MAAKVINISQLYGKDLYASSGSPINIRGSAGMYGKVLAQVKAGDKIGKVYTHSTGRDVKGNIDGSIWLQLEEKYKNPSGFGAWVKYEPSNFDWSALKQQGVKTIEEEIKEKEEKDKSGFDKALDFLKGAGKWILIGYVGLHVWESNNKRR